MESIKKEKENQRKTNKMFVKGSTLDNIVVSQNIKASTIRVNREYLISQTAAEKFNSYVNFDPFPIFNDGAELVYDKGELLTDRGKGPGTPGVRSLFNKAGAVALGSSDGNMSVNVVEDVASSWRISNNVPLMDNVESRRAIRKHSGCSIKELVIASENGDLGRATYDFSDFMYCKHLGKISNNYLITLRRFPLPVDDYISTLGVDEMTRRSKDIRSKNVQSIGCLVNWMGTPGNEMSNILKYSYNMPYKEQEAQWEDDNTNADSQTGILNSVASMFDKTYQQEYQAGMAGAAFNSHIGKFFKVGESPPYSVQDMKAFRDRNKVYGPVDAIKSTYMRGSEGLKFDQNITLVFDYELRSYNGINGRQAMLDLLSNILNVTYSTGTFWGGGYRSVGAHQNNIFSNLNIFKTKGGFTDFTDAFAKDYSTLTGSIKNSIASNGGFLQTVKNFMNQLGGMLIGGALNRLGRPHKVMLNSLLSPAPVGFWHVTIGNPHHPIMSMGNMILKNTTIEHYGPLGLDDFPTGIKVTCELTRGKPRDIRDIEKIYMHGNDRIYTSMGPKVFEMYKHAKEYRNKKSQLDMRYKKAVEQSISEGAEPTVGPGLEGHLTVSDIKSMSSILQKYFGHQDTYSIYVAACEQENGAHKKKKTGTAGGDSSNRGNKQ